MTRVRRAVGCMTGTSMDAVDAVFVECQGRGLDMRVAVLGGHAVALDELGDRLRPLAAGTPATASDFARAAHDLGEAHARAIEALLRVNPEPPPELCVVHGQTVFHEPPLTWQLLNPWPIARVFEGEVLCDLRGRDADAGGQGAPITPLADWVMFRDPSRDRVIVNLGGFCNITVLPAGIGPEVVEGFDVCACNHVLDGVAGRVLGEPFDRDGHAASLGTVDRTGLKAAMSVLTASASAGRSLGSGDEAAAVVDALCSSLAPHDAVATAVRAVGEVIGAVVRSRAEGAEVVLAGGGALNPRLAAVITETVGGVITTEDLGVRVTHREAAAMAVLGLLAKDGVGVTLPGVTGGRVADRTEGVWIRV